VTLDLWQAEKPDPRPHLLLNLLLVTAMKKAECMGIRLKHIQRDAPGGAYVQIRYDNPARKLKERKLDLPADLLPVLDDYLEHYQPEDALFPCTPRNLEYVLANVAERADIHKRAKKGISFEMLRWTAAALDFRAGVEPTHLRQKLGISEVTWKDTEKKLGRLTRGEPDR
jgi:integrase/recombinase XerD